MTRDTVYMPVHHTGQYDRLLPLAYPDSHVVIVCFGIDSPYSLENVQERWILEVHYYCPEVPILLVGCKKDLRHDPQTIEILNKALIQPVSYYEGNDVAQKIGAYKYLECSAKNSEGVREVFEHAARAALMPPNHRKPKKKCCFL